MSQRITRRVFAKTGAAATLGLTSLEPAGAMGSPQPDAATQLPAEANILFDDEIVNFLPLEDVAVLAGLSATRLAKSINN